MVRPIVNPSAIIWAGDHLLLYLKPPGVEKATTLISFYRTLYSPEGSGHTALVLSDLEADGWGPEDVRAIYTDNEDLTAWMRQNVVRSPGHPFHEASLPIRTARFEASGAVGQEYRAAIRTGGHEIIMAWSEFEAPLYVEVPKGRIGNDHDVFSLLFPAQSGSVRIDGRPAQGDSYPREVWRQMTGRDLSSALIAVCEVLIAP